MENNLDDIIRELEETMRDIRFCGKEWLMERCEARIQKAGY